MSSDYSTIQGHEPLRVPQGWKQQERAFVVQLEEILDDIYRRFGRLRVKDLGDDLKKIVEDVDGLSYAQYTIDVDRIETEVGQKVDQSTLANYSTTSQTATQISTYVQSSLSNYSTTSQTATQIQTKINNSLQDYSTTAQTATQIQTKINSSLQDYSTTSQTATQIATYVGNNAYGKVSGITINANGIDLTGSKYIKLASGNIELSSGSVKIGDWTFDQTNGLWYQNSSNLNQTFYVHYYNGKAFLETNDSLAICPDGGASVGAIFKNNGVQDYKTRIGLEPYPSPSDTLLSIGTWTNHVDQVCTDYLYYWHGGSQSSRDYKHDIRPLEWSGDKLDELEPVRFQYNGDEKERIGLIYEDTVDIVPEICSEHDGAKAIDYGGLVPMLLKEIQSLRRRVAALENKR